MRCPYCRHDDDAVVDSRPTDAGEAIRRRRSCNHCGQRYSTMERVDPLVLFVRKRDDGVEPYSRAKLAAGLRKATANLTLEEGLLEEALDLVDVKLRQRRQREVSSAEVGEAVLDVLRTLHPVAYVRFASVYKSFTTPEDFRRELADLDHTEASASSSPPAGSRPPAAGDATPARL